MLEEEVQILEVKEPEIDVKYQDKVPTNLKSSFIEVNCE
jgi:hypothetical protein